MKKIKNKYITIYGILNEAVRFCLEIIAQKAVNERTNQYNMLMVKKSEKKVGRAFQKTGFGKVFALQNRKRYTNQGSGVDNNLIFYHTRDKMLEKRAEYCRW